MLRLLWAPGHVLGNVDDGVEDLRGVGCVGRLKRALPGRTGRHLETHFYSEGKLYISWQE